MLGVELADLAFDVRNLEDLVVHDGPVPEVALLAEQLAVVGGDDDVGVLWDVVVELLEHLVEVADGVDLAAAQLVELVLVEEGGGVIELQPEFDVLEHLFMRLTTGDAPAEKYV